MLSRPVASTRDQAAGAEDIVIADFEGDTYGAWTTTGAAFGSAPARGMLPRRAERAEFEPGGAQGVVFTVRCATIIYDVAKQELVVNGQRAPAPLRHGRRRPTIFCDRMGLEVFASDGLAYVPRPFIPKADDRTLGVRTVGDKANIITLDAHELGSIWKWVRTRRGYALPGAPASSSLTS